MIVTFSIAEGDNKFNADSIIHKTFCIDNGREQHLITNSIHICIWEVAFYRFHFDIIPTFCHYRFPFRYFTCFSEIISNNHISTFIHRIVEFRDIVINHPLHSEARSNFCDGLFDILYPFRGITFSILSEIERNNLVFKHRIDSSGIELILISLVFVSTFFRKSPTGAFHVTFKPPTIENREV